MWASEKPRIDEKVSRDKEAFVQAWLREPDSFKAAAIVVGASNIGRALQISAEWVSDEWVLSRRQELLDEFGEGHFLPTKAAAARLALELHDKSRFSEDKLKALRLFADIMGYIPKVDASGRIGSGLVAVSVTETDAKL